ncbi:mucin-1 [Hoplias malabaricus]|uniref:mucin-1 n=1 Tax=Hoplias malabaricus TaxID=27720 RepID=UPI0034628435
MRVLRFRSGSVITDTEVDFSSNETLPSPSSVKDVVVEAANNSTLGFNITADSVNVSTAIIPTQAPSDTQTTIFSSANQTTVLTSASTTTKPASAFNVIFSINRTFDSNLSNSTSPQFKALADNITTQISPFFQASFPKNFLGMQVLEFRNGSIVTTLEVLFSSGTVTQGQVYDTILNAVKNGNLSFSVIPSSISVIQTLGNSTTVPPKPNIATGIAGSLPVLFMSLIVMLLSAAFHY